MKWLRLLLLLLCTSLPACATSMEVVLLGTGFPRPDAERAGPSSAVIVHAADGDRVFLVDAGRGVMMRYATLKIPYTAIRAVFLTHLHSDHTADLPDVFTTTWIFGREKALEVYGPQGVKGMSDGLLKFFAEDIRIRRDLTEKNPSEGAKIDAHTIREGVVYQDADVKITAFLVDHGPVKPAFGYLFEGGGRKIVISGDTRPSENLVKYATGADVLVHEVYAPGYFEAHNPPERAAALKAYHTSADEVAGVANRAGVKLLVLTHIVALGDKDFQLVQEHVAARFKGRFVLGKDLMRF